MKYKQKATGHTKPSRFGSVKKYYSKHGKVTLAAIFIVIFGGIGAYLLFSSKAATGGHLRLGVYTGNDAQGQAEFAGVVGHPVQVVSAYWDTRWSPDYIFTSGGATAWLKGDPNRRVVLGINPFMDAPGNWGDQAVDSQMVGLANYLINQGIPDQVVFRFAYELNGNYGFPWQAPTHGDSAGWVAMWRRVHDKVHAVHHFLWDWCVVPWENAEGGMNALYPGDAYVDIIGMDNYDTYVYGTQAQRWATTQGRLQVGTDFANAHGKMKSIDESALWTTADTERNGGGDNATYMTNILNYAAANNYEWYIYFQTNPDGGGVIQNFPNGLNAYRSWWASYVPGSGGTPTPPPPPPSNIDLTVTSVTMQPTNPAPGQNVTFTANVKNQGTAATPAGTVIGIAFSINGVFVSWSDNSSTSLAAGASRSFTANSGPDNDAFWTPTTAGTYTLDTEVNNALSTGRRFSESNETNNIKTQNVTVASATPTTTPDLIVTDLRWTPTVPLVGQQVTFVADVKNQGTGPTTDGVIIGVAFSVDGTILTWSDNSTAALAPGASRTLTANGGLTATTWPAVLGTHSIEAWVDNVARFPNEANTTNNKLTKSLVVGTTTPTPTFRSEDINQDGIVNLLDFSILAANFGKSSGLTNARADVNMDGTVNLLDFSLLSSKFGT